MLCRCNAAAAAGRQNEEGDVMKLDVTSLDGDDAGSQSSCPTRIFGLEPRSDLIQRCVHVAARPSASAGTHKAKTRAEIVAHRARSSRAEGLAAMRRHGSAQAPHLPSAAVSAFGPRRAPHAHRPAQEGARARR